MTVAVRPCSGVHDVARHAHREVPPGLLSMLSCGLVLWKGNSFPIAGKERSLDQIEHEIPRVEFTEPAGFSARGIFCATPGSHVLLFQARAAARLGDGFRLRIGDLFSTEGAFPYRFPEEMILVQRNLSGGLLS